MGELAPVVSFGGPLGTRHEANSDWTNNKLERKRRRMVARVLM